MTSVASSRLTSSQWRRGHLDVTDRRRFCLDCVVIAFPDACVSPQVLFSEGVRRMFAYHVDAVVKIFKE